LTRITRCRRAGLIPALVLAVASHGDKKVEKDLESGVVTVRPGEHQDWRVAIEGRIGDLRFSARRLALDFARAYAKLRRAGAIQVYNAAGVVDHEERVDLSPSGRETVDLSPSRRA
jgi:hypothetical protein